MYQLEVKAALVAALFKPGEGWNVTVDIDAMEQARGGSHPTDKALRAKRAEKQLIDLGVTIGKHDLFGRADIVAEHPEEGTVVVEAEGDSSRQREQALYSALGQILVLMRRFNGSISYGIAVPDKEEWTKQLTKIPKVVADRLSLKLFAVSERGARRIVPGPAEFAEHR